MIVIEQRTPHLRAVTQLLSESDLATVRTQLDEQLNKASAQLIAHMAQTATASEDGEADAVMALLQTRVSRLGQLAAGLAIVEPGDMPVVGAGYGSKVMVQDVDTGTIFEYSLMVGSLVDIDAGQVSLGSPIGQALIGRVPDEEVTIQTPHKRVRLRIEEVETLREALEVHDQRR